MGRIGHQYGEKRTHNKAEKRVAIFVFFF